MELPQTIASGPFEIGAAGRSLVLGEVSGDAWDALFGGDCLTVVLVDGVGHGRLANAAAVAAISSVRKVLEREPMSSLDAVMHACDVALRGTRGAALGICRFNPSTSSVSYCGVGNTAFHRCPYRRGLGVSLPGTVGYMMRSVRVFEADLAIGDAYGFHTDGVSSSFALREYATLPAPEAAARALSDHGKLIDDATVVIVRYRG